ncbi:MAG: helix-turn-helix domain-containing protein [Lactobacillaceae bacterium]|jgi:DNA-binding XRE family transcriptional regulator|nr:helix-turn-helix domain-containing protein [Lactobacillaceae bacterium]
MEYEQIKERLLQIEKIINENSPDTQIVWDASKEFDEIVFANITIREFAFIIEHVEPELNNDKVAQMVVAAAEGRPLTDVIQLSAGAEAAYKISHLRKAQKISQVELAKEIGVTQGTVAKIENVQIPLTVDVLQRIMTVLGEAFTIKPLQNNLA